MNCKEYLDVQNSYIDGMVDAETRAQVEAHLAECPECAKVHAEMKTIIEAVREGTEIDVPENLAAEILTAVKANQEKVVPFKLPKFLKSWQFYSSLAACFFLVFTMNQRTRVILSRSSLIESRTVVPARPEKQSYPIMPYIFPATNEAVTKASPEPNIPDTAKEQDPVPALGALTPPSTTVPAPSPVFPVTGPQPAPRTVTPSPASSPAPVAPQTTPAKPQNTPTPTAKPQNTPKPTAKPQNTPKPTATPQVTPVLSPKPAPTPPKAKTYSAVQSLVKRSITFVVDSEKAKAVFSENRDRGEAAVRRALTDAGYEFSTRESIVEEYASQYNAIVKEANALAERIAKGETHLSTQLTEKEQKMLSLKNDCKTPVLRVAYQ